MPCPWPAMAPKGSKSAKQAERRQAKKDVKNEPEEAERSTLSDKTLVDLAKSLVLGSVVVEYAPSLQQLVMGAVDDLKAGKKPMSGAVEAAKEPKTNGTNGDHKEETNGSNGDEKEDTNGTDEKEENGNGAEAPSGPPEIYASIKGRFAWYNCLGLAAPRSGEEAKAAWFALKKLEVDGGPRAKRKGNPGLDRVVANVRNNMAQYFHVLLAMMMLRAFLFRSYFACLPWLVGYQFLSVFLPLEKIPEVPQLDLAKVDIRFRVAASVILNFLVWLFFAYEALWRANFLEKFLYIGIIVTHAYVVRPAE